MEILRSGFNFLQGITLKKRIVLIFAVGTLIPFVSAVLISYNTISSILTSKLDDDVRNNLKQVRQSLESTINNLNHVSQQLSISGSVGMKLNTYLTTEQQYDRAQLRQEINSELNVITFTNPNIGLTTYYLDQENTHLFNNSGVKDDFSIDRLPMLASHYKIMNFGPHISNERYNDQLVLSSVREVDMPARNDVFVYIESGFELTQNILQSDQEGKQSFHLMLDRDGRIIYNELESMFSVNTSFQGSYFVNDSGLMDDYYWFKETSDQGWSIISLIPRAKYNREKNQWIVQMIYLSLLFGVISLLIAWMLWKMVYKPLRHFDTEIERMTKSDFNANDVRTKIPEYDDLLKQFQRMKKQIADLFKEVEQKEKRRANLEVEKLLYQINPHFLMNTLDTVRWLAVLKGQKEIDRLVSALNKLLHYNLGKLDQTSTIREEIDSLRQYLTLQQIRYDFEFDVRILTDEEILNAPVPRFILQPLVENALYHGLNDKGYIDVQVKRRNDYVEIAVHDNGAGIPEDELHKLLHQNQVQQQKNGMGIGINYVKRMIENYYDGQARLEIKSVLGKGTSIYLISPILEVESRDKSTDRG